MVGSKLIGQSFTDAKGTPLVQYFQSRPSAAGAGYDPTASSASNLGPESIVDILPDPSVKDDTGKQRLLTQVCGRSLAIGQLEGVDGSRPFCTPDGVGAVLAVFYAGPGYHGAITRVVSVNQACPATPFLATYHGVTVECGKFGADYSNGKIVPIRGDAPAHPAVPADAVTASGVGPGSGDQSGLREPARGPSRQGQGYHRRAGLGAGEQVQEGPRPRLHGRAPGERPATEPGSRQGLPVHQEVIGGAR